MRGEDAVDDDMSEVVSQIIGRLLKVHTVFHKDSAAAVRLKKDLKARECRH